MTSEYAFAEQRAVSLGDAVVAEESIVLLILAYASSSEKDVFSDAIEDLCRIYFEQRCLLVGESERRHI